MAQDCFNAAANTLSTLEKRGLKMNMILVKLAEVSFLLYNFKESEIVADTLIKRGYPDQGSIIFAFLLKSFFLTLKNEQSQADIFLKRAQSLKPEASVDELPVIKQMRSFRANLSESRP